MVGGLLGVVMQLESTTDGISRLHIGDDDCHDRRLQKCPELSLEQKEW